MEDDPEDDFAYKLLPDEDPDVERAWQKYLSPIFYEGVDLQNYPPDLLEWEDYVPEDVVPTAEMIHFSNDDVQIEEHMEYSDEDNEDALVVEELLIDNNSLVHEPLLGQRDETWNDILEWPDSELNSISCGVDCPVGTLSFTIAQQDLIHWDKLIYLQDSEQWNYTDLENASVEYSQALCHADLPVPSLLSPQLELQESGYPRHEGEYDGVFDGLHLEIPDERVAQVLEHREGSASQPGVFDGSQLDISEEWVDQVLERKEGSASQSGVFDGSQLEISDEWVDQVLECKEGSASQPGVFDGSQLEISDEWVDQVLERKEGSASQPGGDLVGDVTYDAAHLESDSLADHVCLEHQEGSHSQSELPRAILTELSLESSQSELQSNLPMTEELDVLEQL